MNKDAQEHLGLNEQGRTRAPRFKWIRIWKVINPNCKHVYKAAAKKIKNIFTEYFYINMLQIYLES